MHYNQSAFVDSVRAEQRARAARHRITAESADLDAVVRAASAGDGAAWAALVDRFAGRVRAVAQAHRLSPHDAEDVMQSTWLRLFEHIASVRVPRAVGGWIATTARRESLRAVQAARRQQPTEHEFLDTEIVEPVDADRLAEAERRSAWPARWEALRPRRGAARHAVRRAGAELRGDLGGARHAGREHRPDPPAHDRPAPPRP